ncbi:MAG: serine hydrolase domain-containing protein [Bacteroidota bacterium]
MKAKSSILWICLLTVSCLSSFAQVDKSLEQQVDSIFQSFDNDYTPGVAVGFIKDNEWILSKTYGMANLDYQVPVSDSSVFSLASVSKQFTAFGILLLKEQGRLSLEDDIRNYLPLFKDYGTVITIRMLIEHTSGIRSHLSLLGQAGYYPDDVITASTVHDAIYRQESLNFTPDADFSYSNSGYFLLAEIIEKVSGQSFAAFMQKEILTALNMNDSFVMDNYNTIVSNKATSYGLQGDQYATATANYSYYGSTNLYTSLRDLSKWVQNFTQPKIGNTAMFQQLNQQFALKSDESFRYNMGQFHSTWNGLPCIQHSGADAGYRAFLGRFLEQRAAVFIISGNGTLDAQAKAEEVAHLFLKSYYPAKKSKTSVATNTTNEETLTDTYEYATEELNQFEGCYYSKELRTIYSIRLVDEHITVQQRQFGTIQLNTLSEDQFSSTSWQFQTLHFERNDDSEVIGFRINAPRAQGVHFEKIRLNNCH